MKNKIKQFREHLGLTQEQLGELIGVSRQAINSIETEKFEPSIRPMILQKYFTVP